MSNSVRTKKPGFTLIEILVVVALIAILAAITIVAINPARNFAAANDAKRSSDVTAILNAITQYTSEQGNSIDDFEADQGNGAGAVSIPVCGVGTVDIGVDTGNLDIAELLVDTYIVAIPLDPDAADYDDTLYDICQTSGGRIEVSAPNAQNGTISVTR